MLHYSKSYGNLHVNRRAPRQAPPSVLIKTKPKRRVKQDDELKVLEFMIKRLKQVEIVGGGMNNQFIVGK